MGVESNFGGKHTSLYSIFFICSNIKMNSFKSFIIQFILIAICCCCCCFIWILSNCIVLDIIQGLCAGNMSKMSKFNVQIQFFTNDFPGSMPKFSVQVQCAWFIWHTLGNALPHCVPICKLGVPSKHPQYIQRHYPNWGWPPPSNPIFDKFYLTWCWSYWPPWGRSSLPPLEFLTKIMKF